MQEKTIRLIIRIAEFVVGVAILLKDILLNGGKKDDGKGNTKTK